MKTQANYLKALAGAVVMLALLASPLAQAKLFFQDFSLSLLSGSNYEKQEVGGDQTQDQRRQVVTFEHASGHSWGDTFLFIDRLHSRSSDYGNHALYGEFQPNLSIAKLAGWDLQDSFVKDFVFATQWEFGSGDNGSSGNVGSRNSFDNFLYGVGVNLAVPGASFFKVFLYKRQNDEQIFDRRSGNDRGDNEQLTVVWRFDFADDRVRFDGFLDAASSFDLKNDAGVQSAGNGETSVNFTPQLKYDIGRHLGTKPKSLWAGVEWVKWNNKFGNKDWDEDNVNLLLKWHF